MNEQSEIKKRIEAAILDRLQDVPMGSGKPTSLADIRNTTTGASDDLIIAVLEEMKRDGKIIYKIDQVDGRYHIRHPNDPWFASDPTS